MKKRTLTALALIILCGTLVPAANDQPDSGMNWKIRQEVTENSQIMRLLHELTDVHGPRLTGSPSFKAACEWSINRMRSYGLQNGHLEKWDFGHPAWTNEYHSVRVLSPYRDLLDARVVAWTPGTNGPLRAKITQIIPPEKPTNDSLQDYLESVKEKIGGRIVLTGAHVPMPVTFNPINKRREDSELRAQFDPAASAPQRPPKQPENQNKPLDARQVDEKIDAFLAANGAAARIIDSAREHGQIRVFANRTYNLSKAVPSIAIRNEDYGRMSRLLSGGSEVEIEINISNKTYPDAEAMNAIAEIPGTDLKDEVVILGAHIDSWHAGMGATDNATGVAVMMEAARILTKLGLQPRRTIRVALWGGEEQGLLGSKAYVRDHLGTFESQKPEFSRLAALINLDGGTGRIRGASVFGPAESAAVLRRILHPFSDLGIVGTSTNQIRSYGGTDSTSFVWAGLPAIHLLQDPIEYQSHTWHTNLDTYERIVEEDVKQCVIVTASLAYHLAMRGEMLPRFTDAAMPPPEK